MEAQEGVFFPGREGQRKHREPVPGLGASALLVSRRRVFRPLGEPDLFRDGRTDSSMVESGASPAQDCQS